MIQHQAWKIALILVLLIDARCRLNETKSYWSWMSVFIITKQLSKEAVFKKWIVSLSTVSVNWSLFTLAQGEWFTTFYRALWILLIGNLWLFQVFLGFLESPLRWLCLNFKSPIRFLWQFTPNQPFWQMLEFAWHVICFMFSASGSFFFF